jgi:hypothetical protein
VTVPVPVPSELRKVIIVIQAVCVKKGNLPAWTLIVYLPLLSRIQRECIPLEKIEKKAKADGSEGRAG